MDLKNRKRNGPERINQLERMRNTQMTSREMDAWAGWEKRVVKRYEVSDCPVGIEAIRRSVAGTWMTVARATKTVWRKEGDTPLRDATSSLLAERLVSTRKSAPCSHSSIFMNLSVPTSCGRKYIGTKAMTRGTAM